MEGNQLYKTAIGTIRDLAVFARNETAQKIWEFLGGDEINDEAARLTSGKPYLVELRYKSSNELIRNLSAKQGIKQAIEIASGFTPHAKELLSDNILDNYIEVDLPLNIEKKKKINDYLQPDLKIEYVAGDIYAETTWKQVSKYLLPGPVAIFSEGFMLYSSETERDTLARFVRLILESHGGYYFFEDSTRFHPEFIGLQNFKEFFEKLEKMSNRKLDSISQEKMTEEWERRGFKIERIVENSNLASEINFPGLTDEISLIKKNYKMWKLSLAN